MSIFSCPICHSKLVLENRVYRCDKNHCFDKSKDNYVNLLVVNQKNSKNPGDDKDMVTARHQFLSKGYYKSLALTLGELATQYTQDNSVVLDSGCGEGYYTFHIEESFNRCSRAVNIGGIDISKWAVRLASKQCTGGEFAVGSAFRLPVAEKSVDLLVNCFSPLCLDEFNRVIKVGGYFLYVVPSRKHLWELKEAVYENPYENQEKIDEYSGFTYVKQVAVDEKIHIDNNLDIKNLFMMTPYGWKTSKQELLKLDSIECLDITIGFNVHIYIKTAEDS